MSPKKMTLPPAEELEQMKMKLGDTGWTVGKFLGEGVQGSVHKVVGAAAYAFPLAVKITPTPLAYEVQFGKALKGKALKELKSTAGYLNGETTMYKTNFRDGGVVPKILPMISVAKGGIGGVNADGYRYLIMEEMSKPLEDAVELLVQDATPDTGVVIGPLAARLVEICQAVHGGGHTAVDVKLDNFMLAHETGTSSSSLPVRLAAALRIVDLALFQQIRKDPRPQPGVLSGNAMYCSPDMHTMKGGRGDDLFMFLMVVADLIIRVKAVVDDKKDIFHWTAIPSYLPWSHLPDDDAILENKTSQLGNVNSDLYQRMPNECAKTMHALFKKAMGYGYGAAPAYDQFSAALKGMVIPMAATARATKRKIVPKRAKASPKPKGKVATPRKVGGATKSKVPLGHDATNLKDPPRSASKYVRPPAGTLKKPPVAAAAASQDPQDMEIDTPPRRMTRSSLSGKP